MEWIKLTEKNHKEAIKKAIAVLRDGGLVVYPTETCYGIGADATNQKAVNKLLAYKTMRGDKPISVAVTGKIMAEKYVHINKTAENIYDNFLPGPITVVSKGKGKLAKGVESPTGTQGIRVPDYSFVFELLKKYKRPITATSANASYKKTPYAIDDILKNISERQKKLIGLIIDAGKLPKRKPSTVIDTTLEGIHIVREGSIKISSPDIFQSSSLEDTERFVHEIYGKLGKNLGKKNIVFLLQGELGAGKTHFAKYLAKKLGVKEVVTSPTFTLCNEYAGKAGGKKVKFHHIDTYRMYNPEEIDALKPEEIFRTPNVVAIEWANKVYGHIGKHLGNAVVVEILISAPGETERVFEYKIKR